MYNRKTIVSGLYMLIASIGLYAQTDESVNLNVIPPSPNALSIMRFGDIPVSPYTGIPNISIPIYNYERNSLYLPISLKYHAGGIRVEEIPSSVGLGWTLNAGGCISRTIRGLPDDMATYGYLYSDSVQNCNALLSPLYPGSKCYNYYSGVEDAEQDIFHVNINNLSFKFTMSKGGDIELDSHRKIKVERISGTLISNSYGNISEWIVTDEDGIKYIFSKKEYSLVYTSPTTFTPHASKYIVTSWYLTQVSTPYNSATISLEYDEYSYSYGLPMSEVYSHAVYTEYYSSISLIAQRIKRINTSDSLSIIFYYDTSGYRCDLIGDNVLDRIEVYAFDKKIKHFNFDYQYMSEGSFIGYSTCSSGSSHLNERLMLYKLQQEGENPYTFNYISGLPARDSKSQDHWGFYNGQPNQTLLPESYYFNYLLGKIDIIGDANRRPDSVLVKNGALSKIIYPTGGSTSFDYEINYANDKMLDYSLESMSYMLDGTSSESLQIEINREQLPNTYLKFTLENLPSQFCDAACGLRALIKQGGTTIHSVDLTKGELDTASAYLNKTIVSSLNNGSYEFTFQYLREDLCPDMGEDPFILKLSYFNESTDDNKLAGGIRIKKIIDQTVPSDTSGQIMRWYEYTYTDSTSSGYILHHPVYLTLFDYGALPDGAFGSLHSSSRVLLGNTQGSPVGYSRVVEHLGDNSENGSIEYKYTSPKEFKDFFGYQPISEYPFVPPSSFENCRGWLIEKAIRDSLGTLIEREEKSYDISSIPYDGITNVKVGADESWTGDGKILIGQAYTNYRFKVNLDTIRIIKYFSGDSIMIETSYEYNSEYNKISCSTLRYLPDGDIQVERFYYPYDFNRDVDAAIDSLFYNNQLNTNIIHELWKGAHESSLLMTGTNVEEYILLNNIPRLGTIYTLKTDIPLSESEILEFDPDLLLRKPEYYSEELIISKYDAHVNILEYKKKEGIYVSIYWGYSSSLPVAKFGNMNYSIIDSNINGIKTELDKLDAFTVMNDPSIRQSLTVINNSIRDKMPSNVSLMTYTYDPGIGMTSQTDINGQTTYFIYDVYGRLEYIRDNDWNILNKYEYNYHIE